MMFRLGRDVSVPRVGALRGRVDRPQSSCSPRSASASRLSGSSNPWLVPLALAPIVLINRSLAVPALQLQARIDPKTGLFNARHFAAALADELSRAQRFDRPLSLMMADLDLLRDINNEHGHLAGDAVLAASPTSSARNSATTTSPRASAARSSRSCCPRRRPAGARDRGSDQPQSLAAARFEVETSSEPIRATISIGVAEYPADGRRRTN